MTYLSWKQWLEVWWTGAFEISLFWWKKLRHCSSQNKGRREILYCEKNCHLSGMHKWSGISRSWNKQNDRMAAWTPEQKKMQEMLPDRCQERSRLTFLIKERQWQYEAFCLIILIKENMSDWLCHGGTSYYMKCPLSMKAGFTKKIHSMFGMGFEDRHLPQ